MRSVVPRMLPKLTVKVRRCHFSKFPAFLFFHNFQLILSSTMARPKPRLWMVKFMALLSCMLLPVYLDIMVPAKIFNIIKLKDDSLDNHRGPQVIVKDGTY